MTNPHSASASGSWLSIETSSEACSVALRIVGDTRERFELAPRRHAELILPMMLSLLAEAELTLGQLDGIAFGRGPGSFTSLRIGIGVVQGLAWGSDLPVCLYLRWLRLPRLRSTSLRADRASSRRSAVSVSPWMQG